MKEVPIDTIKQGDKVQVTDKTLFHKEQNGSPILIKVEGLSKSQDFRLVGIALSENEQQSGFIFMDELIKSNQINKNDIKLFSSELALF